MADFKPLGLEHIKIYRRYLGQYPFDTYEYSFPALYFWRKMLKTEIGFINEALIIKKTGRDGAPYFMQPLGYKTQELARIAERLTGNGASVLFTDVEESFLDELKAVFGDDLSYREDTDNFDYLYESSRLIALRGKKYHAKKNQYNQFVNSYDFEVTSLTEDNAASLCIEFAKNWYQSRPEAGGQLWYELESMEDFLRNAELLGIEGIAVKAGGRMAGFTVGERVNERMGIVHIEKGDLSINGIYAFLNRTLAERCFSGVPVINRQEDLGLEGLRKAKRAYHPLRLVRKYAVEIKKGGAL